jgi:hypothetical protein
MENQNSQIYIEYSDAYDRALKFFREKGAIVIFDDKLSPETESRILSEQKIKYNEMCKTDEICKTDDKILKDDLKNYKIHKKEQCVVCLDDENKVKISFYHSEIIHTVCCEECAKHVKTNRCPLCNVNSAIYLEDENGDLIKLEEKVENFSAYYEDDQYDDEGHLL